MRRRRATSGEGDPDDDLLVELYVRARKVAARIVGAQAAPDIASETMIRALTRWRTISDLPEAWITVTATHLAIDTVRRRPPPVPPASRADSTEHTASRLDLVHALRRLPKRQREVVALRYLVGLSDREIAAALGVGPATVKTHLARATTALRAALTPQELDHAT